MYYIIFRNFIRIPDVVLLSCILNISLTIKVYFIYLQDIDSYIVILLQFNDRCKVDGYGNLLGAY